MFIQNEREVGSAAVQLQRLLQQSDAEKFYALYREQYNHDLSVPNSVGEEWIAVGTFRSKEKEKGGGQAQRVHDWDVCRKGETVIASIP